MGQFSWLDCIDGSQIRDNWRRDVYVLVPADFGGGHLKEELYDGYGRFGNGKPVRLDGTLTGADFHTDDIYELVAIWNREFLGDFKPCKDVPTDFMRYGGLWASDMEALRKQGKTEEDIRQLDEAERRKHFDADVRRFNRDCDRMKDFANGLTEDELRAKYGWSRGDNSHTRLIGIFIACYDEDNERLRYPIKITHDPNAVYEDCGPSLSDPNQGWYSGEDDEDEEVW